MSHQIDPLILQKLEAFSQRRRKLIIFRGVCAALATLIATMMAVALIDWLLVLPDAVRWGLSAVAYLAIIVVEWRSCLTLLLHAPDPRRLARLIEHAEPKLREDLISAVELGDTKSDAAFDSEQFRALVQSDVAARMENMDMERLLPMNLVRRYIGIAIGIAVACIVAFVLTGSQLGTLMMRAILPMANFARVSKVHVHIVEPQPAEMNVAQGDTVPLLIETSGQRTNKAMLETFTKTGGRELVQMTPVGKDRFSATIQVGRENVLYRVRAGDAITKKYELGAVARPAVVRFEKAYVYPEYSRVGTKRVIEENGDLAALEGTQVELRLQTNQKVKDAELRVEQGKKTYVVKLTADGDKLLGKIPLTASGVYRVRLVGAASGFENKFSPEYELRAEPDLVPQVDLDLPKQDLILPSNEIVDVQGTASDDLALAKVSQLVKINDGGWKETPLLKDPGAKARIDRRWDLFEQGVKPGDLVKMKLVATDLKGHRGESRPIQVTITARGFEFKRVQALEQQRQLLKSLQAHEAATMALRKQLVETRDRFAQLPEGDAQRRQLLVATMAALEKFELKNKDAVVALGVVLREAEAGHQTGDLVLIARALSRTNAGGILAARQAVDAVAANPAGSFVREALANAADGSVYAEHRAKMIYDSFRVFLTAEEIDVIAENFQVVAKEQERLDELARHSGDDPAKWAQFANRLRVILTETRSLEEVAGTSIEHATSGMPDRLKQLQKEINKTRTTMEAALAAKAPGKELLGPTAQMTTAYADLARKVLDLRRDMQLAPDQKFADLLVSTHPTYQAFEKISLDTALIARRVTFPAEMRETLVAGTWDSSLQLIKAHGDAEETRVDSDTYFVNDVRSTSLAMQALRLQRTQLPATELTKQIVATGKDFRVLESGHNIAEVVDGLNHLAAAEKWEIYTSKARTSNPRDWMWLNKRLQLLPDEIGKAIVTPEQIPLVQEAQRILWDAQKQPEAQRLAGEMKDRFDRNRTPLSTTHEAERLAAWVKRALDVLRKPIAEARKELAQMAPKLSEMAAQLAKETEKLKNETTEQAKQSEAKKPEAKAEAKNALAAQQKLNEKIDALKDALRADANKQDILKEDGREKARDADDALAMLKEPPVRAEEDLARAAKADQAAAQKQGLEQAAAQQQKLEDALKQVAEHYDNVEKGKADESRLALRATEEKNGVKEELDQQFAKAAELAQMAKASPQELLAQLEKALPNHPAMQKELSAISKNTLAGAEEKLKQASAQENAVAKQVEKQAAQDDAAKNGPANAAEAAKQAAQAAQAAQQAAKAAEEQAKNSGNADAQKHAAQAADQAAKAAQAAQQAAQAAEKMAASPKPADAAQQTAQKANEAAQAAQQAASEAKQAQASAQQAAQKGGDKQPANQQAAQKSSEAAEQAAKAASLAQNAAQQAQQAAQAMAQNASPPAPNTPAGEAPKNPALAQAAQQQNPIGAAAKDAASDIARAARHEDRLQNTPAGEQLKQLGNKIAATAQEQVPNAQMALASAKQAEEAKGAVNAADAELKKNLAQLTGAANAAEQSNATPPAGAGQPPATPPTGTPAGEPAGKPDAGKSADAGKGAPPAGAPAGQPGTPPSGQQAGETAPAVASPQEQVLMARALDALDSALNAAPPASGQPPAGQPAPGAAPAPTQASAQPAQGQAPGAPAPGQAPGAPGQGEAASAAQASMSAAAQAAAAAMRAARSDATSEMPGGPLAQGGTSPVSKGGAETDAAGQGHGALAEAKNKAGEWGKLPKQIAEQLTQGKREGVAGEYRNQIETYYRVIAEKSKKQ